MRINIQDIPEEVLRPEPEGPQVGDVYRVEGGRGGPRLQVIVSVRGGTCYMVIFSAETGEVTGVGQYVDYYLARKRRVGRLLELPVFTVDWSQAEQPWERLHR